MRGVPQVGVLEPEDVGGPHAVVPAEVKHQDAATCFLDEGKIGVVCTAQTSLFASLLSLNKHLDFRKREREPAPF